MADLMASLVTCHGPYNLWSSHAKLALNTLFLLFSWNALLCLFTSVLLTGHLLQEDFPDRQAALGASAGLSGPCACLSAALFPH